MPDRAPRSFPAGPPAPRTVDLDHVLRLVLQRAVALTGADFGHVARIHPDGTARSMAGIGQPPPAVTAAAVCAQSRAAAQAVKTGRVHQSDPGAAPVLLFVPLPMDDDAGLLTLGRWDDARFDDALTARLGDVAPWMALAIGGAHHAQAIADRNMALESAHANLVETLKSQSEFLATAAHELRTPLAAVVGFLRGVCDGICVSPDEERSFIEQANIAANDLMMLINDVLDMTRIDAGRVDFRLEPVSVAAIFDDVRRLFQMQARARRIELTFDAGQPADATVVADGMRLKQVLVNLVGNSLKFTDGGSITVRAIAHETTGSMTIEVVDTGRGIAPEWLSRLFKTFVQAGGGAATGEHGGSGLGLVICKSLMEMMGGAIALESPGEGLGTRAILSLPLAAGCTAAARPEAPASPHIEGPAGGRLVFIVDDNEDFREVVCEYMHEWGYRTATAGFADEAFERIVSLRPDLLVMDLMLPCSGSPTLRTGIDVVAALSQRPEPGCPPVVFLTGAVRIARSLLATLETPPPVEILGKPVSFEVLKQMVQAGLAMSVAHTSAAAVAEVGR